MQSKIKDIKVGDYVKSWDFDSHSAVKAEVIKVWKNKNNTECFRVNDKLTVTGSHQVYTKDGYKLTKDIQIGDKLLGSDGKYTKVKSFRLNSSDVPYVHNLTVKVNNYFANGILVHNGGAGGALWKAGTWHGKDAVVDANMRGLKDSLAAYQELSGMMDDQYAEQTGEISEKLQLQSKSIGAKFAKTGRELQTSIGRTGLATVGGEEIKEFERERELEGETVALTSAHDKAALAREKEKEDLSMKQGLRSTITSAYSKNVGEDDAWKRGSANANVFTGDKTPEAMINKYNEGHQGFSHYCVSPDTKIEMWDKE
mgnify:CR=1 FL=1